MGKWGDRKYIGCGMNKHGIPDVQEVCRGGDITTVISGLFSLLNRKCRQQSNRENYSEFFEKNAHLCRRNPYEFHLRFDVLSKIILP
jgi:hypothetical protein